MNERSRGHTRLSKSIVGLSCLCLLGCVTDISRDTRYQTDYVVGGTYQVKKALFLDRGQKSIFGTWDYRILRQPDSRFAGVPSSVADYERERARDWKNIAGVVTVGTRIKVTKIKLERNPEMGRMIWVAGAIMDGEFAGMNDIELAFISRKSRNEEQFVDVPLIDGDVLERVSEP
jgi:hypothetical protein